MRPQPAPGPPDWSELLEIPAYPEDKGLPRPQTWIRLWPVLIAVPALFIYNIAGSLGFMQWCLVWSCLCFIWLILVLQAKSTRSPRLLLIGAMVCIVLLVIDGALYYFIGSWSGLEWMFAWPLILLGFTLWLSLQSDPPWWWLWVWPVLLALLILVLVFFLGKMG